MIAAAVAVCAPVASAATVPLDGRTFNAACTAANAGDVITVPAGSYGSQTVTCTKAVTFLGQGSPTVAYIAFSSANGPTADGFTLTGGFESKNSKNITVRNSTLYNLAYIEGTTDLLMDHNVHTNAPGGTTWSNGDMIDIYEQSNRPINQRITIQDSVLHGLRAPSATAHSDAIQLCNCAAAGDSQHPLAIKILRNRFYDNECMNLRTNPNDEILVEGNVFGDTVTGISGCGSNSLDVLAANATVRYNTFTGSQKVQTNTSADYGQSQTWVGNAGVGMGTACGAIRGTYANNVWTGQKCATSDKQVSSLQLNSDGTPKAGSPVIDAGSTATYPATDYAGTARYSGAAPDAGAFEFDSGGTTPPPADTTAPDTTITTAPAGGTATSASIAFTANESGSTFECKLDAGSYGSCTSPKAYSGLAVGAHTFSVRATDAAGNVDASPATTSWTVSAPADTTAPVTSITSAPADGTATSASIAFTSNEAGSTFECKLDAGSFAACTSPKAYSGLASGTHTFSVRATDPAGNVDATPATASWTISDPTPVDTTAPVTSITSAPADGTATSASIAFASNESGSTFQCKLDAGSFAACTSPKAYTNLASGTHTFSVRATDPAGNVDATPATASWTISDPTPVDTTAPAVTITDKPATGTTSTAASLAFSATDDTTPAGSLTFRCKLDTGSYAACTSPKAYTNLAYGAHTFSVRATDGAGNQSAPVTATWTSVAPDTTAPAVTITSKPSAVTPSLSTSASFAFTGTDNVTAPAALTFRCTLDGGVAADCGSPTTVDGLGLGFHTFTVVSVDAAGNVSAPASATWSVIAIPVIDDTNNNGNGKGKGNAKPTPTTTAPAPAPAPTPTVAPALVAPTVSLLAPSTGTRFRDTLTAKAAATDDGSVDHVEFWLDRKRFGYDSTAPYSASMATSKVKAGAHTLVTRAVDDQGLAASLGTAVQRVTGASTASSKVARAAASTGETTTALLATGPKAATVVVGLTGCGDAQAKVIKKVTLKLGKAGRAGTSIPAGRLCVAAVGLRK